MKMSSVFKDLKRLPVKINYRYPKLLAWMTDEKCLNFWYKYMFGKKLDLNTPKTFNEKLQWLKLYDRKPIYTTMVDKYEAKNYVADNIGEEYIIPTLGVWDRFEDIDFDSLPDQFVLKCTHDSGGLAICRDKNRFDIRLAKRRIKRSLKRNFYWVGREWPYKDVKPRIIAEKYICTHENQELTDYKIMCFNGKAKCIFTCTDRYSESGLKVTFFDLEWKRLPFERHYPAEKNDVLRPVNLRLMIELAEIIAHDLTFARIDFYELDGRVYFGEITFFPGNGLEEFTPEEWDNTLGSWIKLPEIKAANNREI